MPVLPNHHLISTMVLRRCHFTSIPLIVQDSNTTVQNLRKAVLFVNRHLNTSTIDATSTSTSEEPTEGWQSVCGPPLIRSPFENPRRRFVYKATLIEERRTDFLSQTPTIAIEQQQKKVLDTKGIDVEAQTITQSKKVISHKSHLSSQAGFVLNQMRRGIGELRHAVRVMTFTQPPTPRERVEMEMERNKEQMNRTEADIVSVPSPPADVASDKPDTGKFAFQSLSFLRTATSNSNAITETIEERDEREKNERQQRQLRVVKYGLLFVGAMALGGIGYTIWTFGRSPRDPVTGQLISDQHTGSTLALLWRTIDGFFVYKNYFTEPSREKLLPDPVKPPWHQPKYTVVVETRNILVSPKWDYKRGHHFVKRPALEYLMDVIGYPNFELVIYTSEPMMTGYSVVSQIDPSGHRVNHALFRDCTKYLHGAHIKDLSRLNRDLSKVIFIEWDPKAFQMNPENVLRVPKWEGDMDDTFLVDLAELLKTIHLSDADDVRPILQFYSQFDNPMAEFRRRARMLGQQENQLVASSSTAPSPNADDPMRKYRGNLFGARRHQI